jgi:hypothetical protein
MYIVFLVVKDFIQEEEKQVFSRKMSGYSTKKE